MSEVGPDRFVVATPVTDVLLRSWKGWAWKNERPFLSHVLGGSELINKEKPFLFKSIKKLSVMRNVKQYKYVPVSNFRLTPSIQAETIGVCKNKHMQVRHDFRLLVTVFAPVNVILIVNLSADVHLGHHAERLVGQKRLRSSFTDPISYSHCKPWIKNLRNH